MTPTQPLAAPQDAALPSAAGRAGDPSLALWLGCIVFVVYGSLVPLDFTPHPLEQAWQAFLHMPMLEIGPESRADWISNIVLYVPVGFLTAHALLQSRGNGRAVAPLVAAAAFSVLLAAAVEFAQLFFPPRTVALNDIAAEAIGSVLGIAVASRWSGAFAAFVGAPIAAPRRLAGYLLHAYLIGYLALALFPFDFVLSGAELDARLASNSTGWWLAGASHGLLQATLKLVLEAVLAMPLAWWLARRRPGLGLGAMLLVGLAFGLMLETAQLLMVSGISQGASAAARAVGMASGLLLWRRRSAWVPAALAGWVRHHILPVLAVYVVALLAVNRWFSSDWLGFDIAARRWADVHLLPFYYHYFTSEVEAVVSLTSVVLMYLPLGVMVWCCRAPALNALFIAVGLATVVEAGKLFQSGTHPDPTNLLIAGIAAWGTARLLDVLEASRTKPVPPRAAPAMRAPGTTDGNPAQWRRAACIAGLLAAGIGVWHYPVLPWLLFLLAAGSAGAAWAFPPIAIPIALAALPALDWAPWSGRLYVDEFDFVLLAAFSAAFWRLGPRPPLPAAADKPLRAVVALLCASLLFGVAGSLLPLRVPDANSFSLLVTPYNSLRLAKGAVWALLLCLLADRLRSAPGVRVERWLAAGMIAGLLVTAAFIVWERVTLAGLLDFKSEYRVTGPFSAMHTGGAYIEAFLVTSLPFLVATALRARTAFVRTAALPMLVVAAYCVMVTFSRSGYAAFFITTLIGLGTFLAGGRRSFRSAAWAAALALVMLAVAAPIYESPFARSRFATVRQDLTAREAHWSDALALRRHDRSGPVLGVGLGAFAERYYWQSAERTGSFRLERDKGNTYVRFGSGQRIYLEQFVAISPGEDLTASFAARSNVPGGAVVVSICEKWLLDSQECVRKATALGHEPGDWQNVRIRFNSGGLGGGHFPFARPVKFSIQSPSVPSTLDIDDLHLRTRSGHDLLSNGDFSDGLDHWFFAADNHLQWHVKSLPLAVLIEQGWLGVLAFASFLTLALVRAWRAARQGVPYAGALLAALCGFLAVGAFDTLIDTPRFLMLLLVLGYFCATCSRSAGTRRAGSAERGAVRPALAARPLPRSGPAL